MRIYNQPVELIIETTAAPTAKNMKEGNMEKLLKNAGIVVTEIKTAESAQAAFAKSGIETTQPEKLYVKTVIRDAEMNPWDAAHQSAKALGTATTFAEPDLLQEFTTDNNIDVPYKKQKSKNAAATTAKSSAGGFDPDWLPHQNIIWHLDQQHSQLKAARDATANIIQTVRIGHLDTGYSKTHPVIADAIKNNPLQRNFVEGENLNNAQDPLLEGHLRMPGHGTGTLGILAGGKIRLQTDDGGFNDYLGGAPFAEVVCCRIAPSVVLMKTSAFADAVNYLTRVSLSGTPVQVISMSMGGAPAKAWADAVNAAYDAGIIVVTAAGNNFNGLPTQHVIYPARFQRVITACGVTFDYAPYSTRKLGEMQGCYGPARHMAKALAAFTPNTPWASATSGKINFSGAGTSSATPQIAAAAAIYYKKYFNELAALEPWQRVEAVRNALYRTALKKVNRFNGRYTECFGNGILQAFDALSIPVGKPARKTPEDRMPWFPIITTLFKAAPRLQQNTKQTMLNTELAQLVYYHPELARLIDNETKPFEKISQKKWRAFADAVIEHPAASVTLKKHLMQTQANR